MGRDMGPGERDPDRGASEAVGGVPLDHQETRARTGPRAEGDPDLITEDDGSGVAGGSSGASGGGSNTPGHPDAPR
ncbi:hypothetical protein SAMN05444365_10410 [Micromonospora pattaloongensis]|uniref:Uncharacterized protein n=1 Tax=Micromonospora pattaloongensis TaxID=405436 RepID=A0A1H3NIC8_9ACTN|nr:preprotein translocase YidC [Micromonospora pattaloongensis]SDY88667.1 hypothetical protein SAMN05444365_10410 [Micromonospora pattaloongensis]